MLWLTTLIKKRAFVHHYTVPSRIFIRILDEKGNTIIEEEIPGNKLADILFNIYRPMQCSHRRLSEEYAIIECRIAEDIFEVYENIL